jgi:hypothetical protein
MTRPKKTFKLQKRNLKKTTRRRGGQLTPLSDISTNTSIHDLDDYDEPSNNTTSESMMMNNTTTTTTSIPVAANLLGQFNAAANDESLNLSNNTTLASDASSENSFSDVATSFGSLGHGGRKKMKKGKKTRRHKKSRKSRQYRKR